MRRCLDCPRFVGSGSRCERCRKRHERAREEARGPRRSSYSRSTLPRLAKERDGQRCRVAGCRTPTDRIEAHHIKPLAAGGADELGNMITLCHGHHREIHRGG